MINAPEQEIYSCSVPDTCTQKYDHLIYRLCWNFAFPVPAKRVYTRYSMKPSGQGNMPSSPEITDASTDIRIIKVLFEMESEHPAQTDRHIAVSAEVKINLQHIGNGTQPCPCCVNVSGRCSKKLVRDKSHGIGNQNLFTESG